MDYVARQQKNGFAAGEEMWGGAACERRNPVVLCPRPRRLSELAGAAADAERLQLRWPAPESKAGADLLEIFLTKVSICWYPFWKYPCAPAPLKYQPRKNPGPKCIRKLDGVEITSAVLSL